MVYSLLDTDLYKFTTSYAYMKLFPDAKCQFVFKDRNNTPRTEEFLENFKKAYKKYCEETFLSEEEWRWLMQPDIIPGIPKVYWEWLFGFYYEYDKVNIYLDENKVLCIEGPFDYAFKASLYEIPSMFLVPEVNNVDKPIAWTEFINDLDKTIYEVLRDEIAIEEAIISLDHCFKDLYLLPANRNLAGAEIELITASNMQYILKEKLKPIRELYDYIIVDCPPALGMLTVNAMTAADTVLVPIQCEFYALDGLSQLLYTINLIQNNLNPELYLEGVVFTMYDARTNLSLQVVENVKDNLDYNIYKTIIPRNVRLAEAPSHGLPINLYDKRSSGSEAYKQLADEVMEN